MTSSSSSSSPSLQILTREPSGFSLSTGPPFADGHPGVKLQGSPCSSSSFSPDGSLLLAVTDSNAAVRLYDTSTFAETLSFQIAGVAAAVISPRSTYLQTFRKPSPGSQQEKNVVLWNTTTSAPVYELFQKNISKTTWPTIRFSDDESVACRMATNEIQFFDAKDFSKGILYRLRIPGLVAMELPKSPASHVAAFVPESKGIPASVQIFSCEKNLQSQAVARRSFFRCSSVQMLWNRGSTGLLVVAQSDVDKSNQSYYGETKLNYLTTDGSHEGHVPLRKEGPVHDVQWSPLGTEFVVVYGFMPAKVTLFDKKCNPIFELGTGPYNTLRWNPRGKLLCVAGFGNLPGDMAFWDCSEKKLLGTTKSECSVTCEWSPDGRYLMTATTAPRLQIDNGIKIFHHDGSLYYKKMYDKLYQAEWKPEALDKFGDVEELTKAVKESFKIDSSNKGSKPLRPAQPSQPSVKASNPPQKAAAYRPPHAKSVAAVQAELFGETGPSEEISKNALRNKKKREKQREKKAAEAASSINGS
ncbi:eukaryotic translation initiation factor 2A [Nymphaea colorata]|nr:eukaryotic translation initiation factor 2A [Nymphaea colorata]